MQYSMSTCAFVQHTYDQVNATMAYIMFWCTYYFLYVDSAQDADSLPTPDASRKREGAFIVWTAAEIDFTLSKSTTTLNTKPPSNTVTSSIDSSSSSSGDMTLAQLFKAAYGVKSEGNCDPQHDLHGELQGQNVLYRAATADDLIRK
jgi:uncharacterized protein YyaL (SSP411 family)